MPPSIQKFLRSKGAVGLLSLLHECPKTYSEIEPEIEITGSTITTRRDEAAELGLIDVSLGRGDVGTKKVYHLTDMGEMITQQMAQTGLVSNYRRMRTYQEAVEEDTDEVVSWVTENPSQLLVFEEAVGGTIIDDDE